MSEHTAVTIRRPHSDDRPSDGTSTMHDAFISYSRKNTVFASQLEKGLESYTAPKELDIPQRRLDVFRDEEDFTGTEYYAAINKHLKASRKLIVICSPAARASKYVDEEIRIFAEANGSNNIIPILLEGIPNNEASPEQQAEMAFPDALFEVMRMPLAIGYRGFRPGKDKVNKDIYDGSWFSLLANLYEISRSEIEQRERKRRARIRNYRIGGVSIVLTVVLLSLKYSLPSAIQAGWVAAVISILSILAYVERNHAAKKKMKRCAESQSFSPTRVESRPLRADLIWGSSSPCWPCLVALIAPIALGFGRQKSRYTVPLHSKHSG
jgi:hypothetical protein